MSFSFLVGYLSLEDRGLPNVTVAVAVGMDGNGLDENDFGRVKRVVVGELELELKGLVFVQRPWGSFELNPPAVSPIITCTYVGIKSVWRCIV